MKAIEIRDIIDNFDWDEFPITRREARKIMGEHGINFADYGGPLFAKPIYIFLGY